MIIITGMMTLGAALTAAFGVGSGTAIVYFGLRDSQKDKKDQETTSNSSYDSALNPRPIEFGTGA